MKIKIAIMMLPLALGAGEITLGQAYEMALENDENVKSVMYDSMAAVQRTKQATSALLPSLDAEVLYNGEKYDKNMGGSKTRMDETFTKYGVSLSQPLFRMDLWYNRAQESLREDGYALIHDSSKQELAKKVAEAYFNLAFANESLKLAKSYEDANKLKYQQMEKSLNMGLVNKMDALEAKVRYDEAMLDVQKAFRQIEVARLALAKFVGEEVSVKNSFEDLNVGFFEGVDVGLYEDIAKNLEYRQSEIATQIATKEKHKRVSQMAPSVNFSVGLANYNYKDDDRFGDENNKVETMIRFNMPLFKSGMIMESIEEGELLKLSSMSKQLDTQKKVAVEQKTAVSEFKTYLQEAAIMLKSLEHAKTYEIAIERGYQEGLKNIVDLLDARARVYKTRTDALNTGYKLILSYLNMEYLIGNISTQTIKNMERAFNY